MTMEAANRISEAFVVPLYRLEVGVTVIGPTRLFRNRNKETPGRALHIAA